MERVCAARAAEQSNKNKSALFAQNEMFRDLFDVQVSNCIEWDFQSVSGLSFFVLHGKCPSIKGLHVADMTEKPNVNNNKYNNL